MKTESLDSSVIKTQEEKKFKEENIEDNEMAYQYKNFVQAVKRRKRGEITVYDRRKNVFLNKKIKKWRAMKR